MYIYVKEENYQKLVSFSLDHSINNHNSQDLVKTYHQK